MRERDVRGRRRVVLGGVLLGLGVGGFFDGIVFHQILQWHHMVSSVRPATTLEGLRTNTLGDGLFHFGPYLLTLLGLALLWSASRRGHHPWPTQLLSGAVLAGWGLFNLVEGLIDHHLLGVHHVRPGPSQLGWDLAFLGWGVLLLGVGWALLRAARREAGEAPAGEGFLP